MYIIQSYLLPHHYQLFISSSLKHTGSATPNPLGELEILGHDGDPFGVDGAEHGVLEQDGEVRLRSLLKGQNSDSLEPGTKC